MKIGEKSSFLLERPIWSSIRVESAHLYGTQPNAFSPDGVWQGATSDAGAELWLGLELARINRPRSSEQDRGSAASRARALLAFTRKFGTLGQQEASSQPGPLYKLDEVAWCLLHAAALDVVLTLAGALSLGHDAIIDFQLAALTPPLAAPDQRLLAPIRETTHRPDLGSSSKTPREERVWQVCEALLNPNLDGVRFLRKNRSIFTFKTLYGLAYTQIATWIEAGQFGRCEDCLSYFPKTDKRQRFCPALSSQQNSRCAMRERARRQKNPDAPQASPQDAETVGLLRQDNILPENFKLLTKSD